MARKRRGARAGARREPPGEAVAGAIGLGLIGYFLGEFLLYGSPHPIHWTVGLVGAGLGALGGLLWGRRPWRGPRHR